MCSRGSGSSQRKYVKKSGSRWKTPVRMLSKHSARQPLPNRKGLSCASVYFVEQACYYDIVKKRGGWNGEIRSYHTLCQSVGRSGEEPGSAHPLRRKA